MSESGSASNTSRSRNPVNLWKGFYVENHTRSLHPNTEAFIRLDPEVATLITEIIHALYFVLRWRQSSKSFLTEILTRLAERDFFECGHAAFSVDLFPGLDNEARKVKISRWNRKIKDDQRDSKYQAVWIEARRAERLPNGEYKGLPTIYRSGDFWNLFKCVQFDAEKCDLMNLPLKNRRQRIKATVQEYLKVVNAIPVDRAKIEEKAKPPNPSPPCKCSCAHCAQCLAKGATGSEADEPVLSVQIEREKKMLREIEERFVSTGQAMLNRGNKLSVVDNKINAVSVAARMRIKAAHSRNGKSGDSLAPDTGARARGRAGLELMVEGLKDAVSAAEEMGLIHAAEEMKTFAGVLEGWNVFQNRNVPKVRTNGGQPK